MQKLMIWAARNFPFDAELAGQLGNRVGAFTDFRYTGGKNEDGIDHGEDGLRNAAPQKGRVPLLNLSSKKQCVKGHSFSQGHSQNGLHEDFTGSAGIAAHGFHGFHSDKPHADGRRHTAETALQPVVKISFYRSYYIYHDDLFLYVFSISFRD